MGLNKNIIPNPKAVTPPIINPYPNILFLGPLYNFIICNPAKIGAFA